MLNYSQLHSQSGPDLAAVQPHIKSANANKRNIKQDKSQLQIIHIIHMTYTAPPQSPLVHFPKILHPNTPDTRLRTTAFIEARPLPRVLSHRNNFLLKPLLYFCLSREGKMGI